MASGPRQVRAQAESRLIPYSTPTDAGPSYRRLPLDSPAARGNIRAILDVGRDNGDAATAETATAVISLCVKAGTDLRDTRTEQLAR